jgi:hypothetical protein
MMEFEVVIRGQKDELLEMCKFFIPKEWNVRVLKGTTQVSYFKELMNTEYDWVVNLDEDAFLINPEKVLCLIKYMKDNDVIYSGVLDGGQLEIRPANPVSMNPFFNVFNVKEIKKVINYNNFDTVIEKYHNELNILVQTQDNSVYRNVDLSKLKYTYTNCYFEQYYVFFYLLNSNFKYLVIDAHYFDKYLDLDPGKRTQVDITTVLNFGGRDFLYHTWYARNYGEDVYHTKRIDNVWNVCRDYTDMKYVTFIIQYVYDHPDRLENLQHILSYLKGNCPCANIIVYELGEEKTVSIEGRRGIKYKFKGVDKDYKWHRTKDFNDIVKNVDTPYICLYDCDVVFDKKSYYDSLRMLKEGIDVVYPYNGTFTSVDRSYLKDGVKIDVGTWGFEFFGGAVFFNRKRFIEAGMENENLVTYGIDDVERKERFKKLEYSIKRTEGVCWHIAHYRGVHSMGVNDEYKKNEAELVKIKSMDKLQLQEYIKTWSWCYE